MKKSLTHVFFSFTKKSLLRGLKEKMNFKKLFLFALSVFVFSSFAFAASCSITDVAVSTSVSSATTGTNIVFTSTSTANDTCTASTIQLVSEGDATSSAFTITDPGSPYYYTNSQVSTSGTTKTFTATAGVADTYNYYVQTTFQGGSRASPTQVLRIISPSTLTLSGTPTSTQNSSSGTSFNTTVTVSNPTNNTVSSSYELSYNSSAFSVAGDSESGTISIGAGSSTTLQWTVTYSANVTATTTESISLQLGDNSGAFTVSATSPATAAAVASTGATSFGSSGGVSTTGIAPPTATAAPAAATPTPAPSKDLGSGASVSGSFEAEVSTFALSYSPSTAFTGTVSYRLPFEYSDYLNGVVSFNPVPDNVREGSIVAQWDVVLAAGEAFSVDVTVAKAALDESILDDFESPTLSEAATPTPRPTAKPTATARPTARPAAPAPVSTTGDADGIDATAAAAVLLLLLIAAGGYWYYSQRNQKAGL